ncbi:MAG: hypothetical protein ACOYD0_12950, partial [Candidatus Nanopelagicales bacterium]
MTAGRSTGVRRSAAPRLTGRRLTGRRSAILGVVAGVAVLTMSACGSDSGASSDSAKDPTTSPAATSASASEALPDQVPMPNDAKLADTVSPIPNAGSATGWTAVAITTTGTDQAATAAALRKQLDTAGWTTKVASESNNGLGIAARMPAKAPVKWLNISVTGPLPDSGPAVTYRYVTVPRPLPTDVSPSQTALRGS